MRVSEYHITVHMYMCCITTSLPRDCKHSIITCNFHFHCFFFHLKYAPYKAGSKRSLAERARELGLEPLALKVLRSPQTANMQSAIKAGKEGR